MSNIPNIQKFSTNGRSGEDINTKSTKMRSTNKEYLASNGRLFDKNYKEQLSIKNLISDKQNSEKKNIFSWVVDTLNPINHIPLINTLNKLDNNDKNSLDMVQSAIGGVIYGGGVGGIAKGLGGWFAGKLLPKNIIVADNKPENKRDLMLMNNGKVTPHITNRMLKKVNLKETHYKNIIPNNDKVKDFNKNTVNDRNKIDIINNEKNYYDFYDKGKKTINKAIDTKA